MEVMEVRYKSRCKWFRIGRRHHPDPAIGFRSAIDGRNWPQFRPYISGYNRGLAILGDD